MIILSLGLAGRMVIVVRVNWRCSLNNHYLINLFNLVSLVRPLRADVIWRRFTRPSIWTVSFESVEQMTTMNTTQMMRISLDLVSFWFYFINFTIFASIAWPHKLRLCGKTLAFCARGPKFDPRYG